MTSPLFDVLVKSGSSIVLTVNAQWKDGASSHVKKSDSISNGIRLNQILTESPLNIRILEYCSWHIPGEGKKKIEMGGGEVRKRGRQQDIIPKGVNVLLFPRFTKSVCRYMPVSCWAPFHL